MAPENDLPPIGEVVVLIDADGIEYRSRVEDCGNGFITVARPVDLRAAIEYVEGFEFQLVWNRVSGVNTLPVELAASGVEDHIRVWHLVATGPGWTQQRRDYVRVATSGHVDIQSAADDEIPPVEGTLVDISEVAAQVAIAVYRDDDRVAVGRVVRCQFAVLGSAYDMRAEIVIVRDGVAERESHVVVRFDEPPVVADKLRRDIFALQLAMRRER